jgi:hypothetical protein
LKNPLTIIYDLGAVVYFWDGNGYNVANWTQCVPRVAAARLGATIADDATATAAILAVQREFEVGAIDVNGHRLGLSRAVGLDQPLTWVEYRFGYLDFEKFCLNRPLLTVMETLNKVGVQQGIISNLCPVWHHVLTRAGVDRHVDEALFSFQEEVRKPDPEIFVRAIDRLGVRAEDVVFIDDIVANVKAATDEPIGMRGLVYTGNRDLYDGLRAHGLPAFALGPLLTEELEPFVPVWPLPG